MKLYAKTIAQTLPNWATTITTCADLIEVEINDKHPDFQSLLEELETEIEPGIMGVKAEDLCFRLGIEMSNPNLCQLLGTCPNSDISYCYAPRLQATARRGI
ncbi:hypothetical protein [Nostoc sp.]|uniref:hypothetical protein n=1 Tax=Nostoc sp. TaxID=1180 RepID=UPI003593B2AB